MGRLPPRALASQRTLLLGGLLLPLALSSALREEVTKSAQGQNSKSTPLSELSTTSESISVGSADQNATRQPNVTTSHTASTCSVKCLRCPPLKICPSFCPACPAPSVCPTCPACMKAIPPGYEHFPGLGYYRLHTVPLKWFSARNTCEREGAQLAVINSQEEVNLMTNLFKRDLKIGQVIYLGFHDMYEEGTFVTLLGPPLEAACYSQWEIGEPDNFGENENCGSMLPSGGLKDINCESRQPFVCELPV